MDKRFEREAMLIGEGGVERLSSARVALFGVGGVGSYAAEALARSGVGFVELIDNDTVSVTNINRQLYALHSTVGQYKVDIAKERMLDINPDVKIETFKTFYSIVVFNLNKTQKFLFIVLLICLTCF